MKQPKKNKKIEYRVCENLYDFRTDFLVELKKQIKMSHISDSELARAIWMEAYLNKEKMMRFYVSLFKAYFRKHGAKANPCCKEFLKKNGIHRLT